MNKDQLTLLYRAGRRHVDQYVEDLFRQIAKDHGYTKVDLRWHDGYRTYVRQGTKKYVKFGREAIEKFWSSGAIEYSTVRYVWSGHDVLQGQQFSTGLKPVWALVLHEAAHYLGGMHEYGSVHNAEFASVVRKLQVEYPFDRDAAATLVESMVPVAFLIAIKENPLCVSDAIQAQRGLTRPEQERLAKRLVRQFSLALSAPATLSPIPDNP